MLPGTLPGVAGDGVVGTQLQPHQVQVHFCAMPWLCLATLYTPALPLSQEGLGAPGAV